MFCEKCGNKLSDNVKFCSVCGAAVESHKTPKKGFTPVKIAIIIVVFLAVAAGSFALAFHMASDTKKEESHSLRIEEEDADDEPSGKKQAETKKTDTKEDIKESTSDNDSAMDAFNAFLDDSIPAVYKDGNERLTLMETANKINQKFLKEFYYSEGELTDIGYAFIDCGNDGISELAVSYNADNSFAGSLVYIYGWDGDNIRELYNYDYAYRTYGKLGKYGVYDTGGSGGATTGVESSYVITPDGKEHFIYSMTYEYSPESLQFEREYNSGQSGRDKGAIGDAIIGSGRKDPDVMFLEYVFEEFDFENEDYEKYYDLPRVYSAEGQDMGFIKDCFDKAGVTYTSESEINEIIEGKYSELGLSMDMAKQEAEWKILTDELDLSLTEGIYGRYEYRDDSKKLTYRICIAPGYSAPENSQTVDPDLSLSIKQDDDYNVQFFNLKLEMQEERGGIIYSTDSDITGGASFSPSFDSLDVTFAAISGNELVNSSFVYKKVK